MSLKRLSDCERIFLDTNFLIDLLNVKSTDVRVLTVRKIRDFFSNPKLKARFYVSTISLSEICELSHSIYSNDLLVDSITTFLNGSDIEIVPFSEDIALHQRELFHQFYNNKFANSFIQSCDPKTTNYVLAREWITKDMMILASASYKSAEVIFTGDEKTFLPMAQHIGAHCVITKDGNFTLSQNGDKIYDFSRE